jgi:hypothetical protein
VKRLALAAFFAGIVVALCFDTRTATLPEYFIHVLPQQRAGMLVWQDTRQYTSQWVTYLNGDVAWGDPNKWQPSYEHMFVRDGWLLIQGFDKYEASCTQAEVEDINSGIRYPLTCRGGHYYSPMLVPRDPWRMRVWGLIAGTRKFYWESDFFTAETAFNPCWFEGAQTKDVIRQLDSWWDEPAGWVRATGTSPYDSAGRPVRPTVTKLWEVTLAKGVGPWTILDKASGRRVCAYSSWPWS